jgi:glucose/mannose transport system substrate-binding protein
MHLYKRCWTIFATLAVMSIFLTACAPQVIRETVVVTRVVTEIVQVPSTPVVKEVIETVVVTPTPAPPEKKLEIFHWWTSPDDGEAAKAMFAAFKARNPDIKLIENPGASRGSANPRTVLQARITAGLPPDTFQTLGGAELKNAVDSGILQPLDELYAELGYVDVIPGTLLKAVSVDGHPYAVPFNIHIQNVLYYNLKLFEELKLTPPTSFKELLAACKLISASKPDMTCLSLGSRDAWAAALILDSLLLDRGGGDYYARLFKGEVNIETDAKFKAALENLQRLIPYINEDHSSLTWEQAVAQVGSGVSAMTLTGSWAIRAFIEKSNWQPGVDFGATTFPQKPERVLLFHSDAYGMTTNAPNPEATTEWLSAVASPELQIPTNVAQGGLFARNDIDPAELFDPIRQELQNFIRENPGKLILDQYGSILPINAQSVYWDIIADFLVKPDANEAIQDTANMMATYSVKEASAWYQWP